MDIEIIAQKFYDYSSHIRGYSKATIVRYRQIINFYRRFANVTTLDQITERNVKDLFMHGRINRGWGANTFIIFHKSLTVFFRWCIQEKYMEGENIMDSIELPKLEKRLPPKLTKQEAMKILDVAYNYPYDYKFLRYRNHAIFSMFIFAGLRKRELLQLKMTDLDIENLTLFVRQGKGNKDRVIPINFTLAETLRKYLNERKRLNKTCPQFFTSLNRDTGFTDTGLKHIVKKIVKTSHVNFTIHKLRHTFATLMLEGGCDIYSLSRMMGHSDIKTTTIYLAASPEHLRSQVGKHPLS